jgi:hypothetical protein
LFLKVGKYNYHKNKNEHARKKELSTNPFSKKTNKFMSGKSDQEKKQKTKENESKQRGEFYKLKHNCQRR